jgi:peptidyl-prolyl cis-trans isomerase C
MRGKILTAALAGLTALLLPAGRAAAQAPAAAQPSARTAAVINGEVIRIDDIDAVLKSRPLPVELSAEKRKVLQREVLAMLIDKALMEQFLRQHGPKVDEAEVNKRMAELEAAVKKANKSMADYYKDTQQTEKEVRTAISQIIQWETYARARISDADVKRYYDENKDFFDGVTVRASHILLRVPLNATDADRQAARQQLSAIRAHIVAGKLDFAEAAKKYSQCPSAKEGGDIGSFPRKMVVEENFAKAAFAMQVGQVSDVVATDFGLHLIKVTERKPGDQPSDFAKIKDVVRDFCTEELRQQALDQQRKTAKIEVFLQ